MRFGSTLINDSFVHADVTVAPMAELGLRVHTGGRIHDADHSLLGAGRWEYDPKIGEKTLGEAIALAEKWHGKENGRIGVQLAAHAPDTCSDRFLEQIADAAERLRLRVNIHLSQSQKEVEQMRKRSGKTSAEVLDDAGLLNDRLLAAHCLFLSEPDVVRMARAGAHIAHCPKANATGASMAPTPKLRAAGINVALGTDNMHADMVETMRWALAVARLQEGRISDDWQPSHVFHMATAGAAKAMGLGDEIGTVEPGKKADLVVFEFRQPHLTPDINPLGNLVHTAQGRDVEHVLVDGRLVIESGRPTLADEAEILREAQKAAEALWKRARS
jgi:5-methylthioadenosine/S-adenosylhomocysteine deaminase